MVIIQKKNSIQVEKIIIVWSFETTFNFKNVAFMYDY